MLVASLKRQGVEVKFKRKGHPDEVQGVVFTMNSYRFNGSKVDKRFSYSKIDTALRRNSHEERQAQVRPQAYREETSPVPSNDGDLISDSLGLLTPDNRPEEQQPYDPYLRNRKKKKHRKINW